MRPLRSLLSVALVVGTGVLVPASAAGTILGGVSMNDGSWPISATNSYAWWSNTGPTVEGMCHLATNAIAGSNSWSPPFDLPFNESRWRCVADGRDVASSGVAVGSTVDFKKLELESVATLGSTAPDFTADYPHVITRVRWDLGRDGTYESDTSSGWVRGQHGESCAGDYRGTWWCWWRAYYLSFTHAFDQVGSFPIELIVNYSDGTSETATATIVAVPDRVAPSLTTTRQWYLTSDQISLDASGSDSVSKALASFAWDLGTGTFGDPKGESTAQVTFATPGTKLLRVRVASRGGSSADTSIPVEVRPAPPSGEVGISINDGEEYTNDPNVNLSPVWPAGANGIRISNDGGFRNAETGVLGEKVAWTLRSSGAERLPKTVYVRFSGSDIDTTKTYQDDIILDQTPPQIVSATAVSSGAKSNARAEMAKKPTPKSVSVRVRLKATDALSGVGTIQVSDNKRKPGLERVYATSASLKTKRKAVFIRAQDRAGNWSAWRTVHVKAKR